MGPGSTLPPTAAQLTEQWLGGSTTAHRASPGGSAGLAAPDTGRPGLLGNLGKLTVSKSQAETLKKHCMGKSPLGPTPMALLLEQREQPA